MCDFNTQSSTLRFLEQFANNVVVDSAKWYLGAHRGIWWKRKYPHIINREEFSQRLLSDVWFITQSSTFPFLEQFLTLLSWILQCDIWEPIGAFGEKGNILTWKLERNVVRDCFPMCDFITQSSTLPFLEHFANTVVLDSAKRYLGAHWGLWSNRK